MMKADISSYCMGKEGDKHSYILQTLTDREVKVIDDMVLDCGLFRLEGTQHGAKGCFGMLMMLD